VAGNPGVTDTVLKEWSAAWPNLQSLSLLWCEKLTDAGLKAFFSKPRGWTSLDLSKCHCLTNATVELVATNLPSLTSLNLSWCERITDESVKALSKVVGLKVLNLSMNRHINKEASAALLPTSCITTW
jgi:F-box/leucine-rich repeat protein 2/20